MKKFFARASATSHVIGLVLGLVHLVISWRVIIGIAWMSGGGGDAQWQLAWVLLFPFDFPFSLIIFLPGIPYWSFDSLPYPVGEFRSFILPAFVHGIIGPLWYYFLPVAISSLWRARRKHINLGCR